jgi:hypothetical protein
MQVGYELFYAIPAQAKVMHTLQKHRETVAKTIFDDCDELKKSFKFGPFLGPHLSCMPDHTRRRSDKEMATGAIKFPGVAHLGLILFKNIYMVQSQQDTVPEIE